MQKSRLVKVLTWRACSVTLTLFLTWLYIGSIKEASSFTALLHIILITAHYIFESLWEKVTEPEKDNL